MQRFNGGKKKNGMISQSPEKERHVSGAECDTQREKQPLQQQHLRVRILELKGFLRFVYATDLSRLRGFPPFQPSSQNAGIYVTLGHWLSKHLVDFQRRASSSRWVRVRKSPTSGHMCQDAAEVTAADVTHVEDDFIERRSESTVVFLPFCCGAGFPAASYLLDRAAHLFVVQLRVCERGGTALWLAGFPLKPRP